MQRREYLAASAGGFLSLGGCLGESETIEPDVLNSTLTLATSTSTYDTGLIGDLNDGFSARFGVDVNVVAQGTGAALATGRRGDADVVMVHARSLEDEFLLEGYGVNRRDIMFNDFVLVGPDTDPSGIQEMDSVTDAFAAVASSDSLFISRGDNSGTHVKEREIWEAADIEPSGEWYREIGSGMGQVLTQANFESAAYTLSDRGTFLSMRAEINLVIHFEGPVKGGPDRLANPYGIVAVNPAVHENLEYDLAMAYIGFLTSVDGQRIIEDYSVGGQQLFFPQVIAGDPNFEQYVPNEWEPSEE